MLISELIAVLQQLLAEHGDLPTRYQTISHEWPPEPTVWERDSGQKIVLLNP